MGKFGVNEHEEDEKPKEQTPVKEKKEEKQKHRTNSMKHVLQPTSDGLQPTTIAMASNLLAMASNREAMASMRNKLYMRLRDSKPEASKRTPIPMMPVDGGAAAHKMQAQRQVRVALVWHVVVNHDVDLSPTMEEPKILKE